MAIGTVTKFVADRGYGFIRPDGGSDGELFVHITCCADGIDELREGQRVEYDAQPSRKYAGRLEATNVRII